MLQLLELSAHRARLRPRQRRLQRAAHNFESCLAWVANRNQLNSTRKNLRRTGSFKRGLTWASAACRLRRSCSESERARAICGETGEVGIGEGSPAPSPAQQPNASVQISLKPYEQLAPSWHQ